MNIRRLADTLADSDGVGWKIAIALLNAMGGLILAISALNFNAIKGISAGLANLREVVFVSNATVNARIDALPPEIYRVTVRDQFEEVEKMNRDLQNRVQSLEFQITGGHTMRRTNTPNPSPIR